MFVCVSENSVYVGQYRMETAYNELYITELTAVLLQSCFPFTQQLL